MYKKILCIFSAFILLFAISFVPVHSNAINLKNIVDFKQKETSLNNINVIEDVVETLKIKIKNDENPLEEIKFLLSFSEIKDIILKISDEKTLYAIESLISDKNIFSKFNDIIDYKNKFDDSNSIYNMSEFKDELTHYIESNHSNESFFFNF